jgi:hypothetical protein
MRPRLLSACRYVLFLLFLSLAAVAFFSRFDQTDWLFLVGAVYFVVGGIDIEVQGENSRPIFSIPSKVRFLSWVIIYITSEFTGYVALLVLLAIFNEAIDGLLSLPFRHAP